MAELHQPHATRSAHAAENPEVHHEESDVNIRGVLMFGGGLIVAAIVILAGYSWVDRNAGIVRIPIDEAIKKTLERGLPARPSQTR
jgi:hypothetical protein